jgi:hypothetical protein
MPSYKIHRLKDHLRQYFRNAPHVSGAATVKPRDYNPGDAADAKSPYAAFFELQGSAAPLAPGDLLESEAGELRIFKFVGFEEARWVLPEAKLDANAEANPKDNPESAFHPTENSSQAIPVAVLVE